MKRSGLVFTLIFGLIGLGMLIGCFFAVSSTLSFRGKSKVGEGVVVELVESRGDKGGTMYKPVVEWTSPDGKKRRFTGSVASSPPSYARGEKAMLRYEPANPESARLDSFMENWFAALILGLLGSVFFAVGAGVGIYGWRKKKAVEWLRAHGTKIQAKFTGVDLNTSLKVNGRSPWVLTAQWQNPADQAIYTFRSDSIWFDPSEFVKGETLDVLINPAKPSMHHIDLGFLPKHGG